MFLLICGETFIDFFSLHVLSSPLSPPVRFVFRVVCLWPQCLNIRDNTALHYYSDCPAGGKLVRSQHLSLLRLSACVFIRLTAFLLSCCFRLLSQSEFFQKGSDPKTRTPNQQSGVNRFHGWHVSVVMERKENTVYDL